MKPFDIIHWNNATLMHEIKVRRFLLDVISRVDSRQSNYWSLCAEANKIKWEIEILDEERKRRGLYWKRKPRMPVPKAVRLTKVIAAAQEGIKAFADSRYFLLELQQYMRTKATS